MSGVLHYSLFSALSASLSRRKKKFFEKLRKRLNSLITILRESKVRDYLTPDLLAIADALTELEQGERCWNTALIDFSRNGLWVENPENWTDDVSDHFHATIQRQNPLVICR